VPGDSHYSKAYADALLYYEARDEQWRKQDIESAANLAWNAGYLEGYRKGVEMMRRREKNGSD
jgi:hypothetical protein